VPRVAREVVAFAWHQRTSSIDARERLLSALPAGPDRVVLATCHRVELYTVAPAGSDPSELAVALGIGTADLANATIHVGAFALAHLFTVAAGLDSAIAGEPQILSQVRRAYSEAAGLDALLVAAFARALYVGREVRASSGLGSARSVGSLAVDCAVAQLADPARATALVVGAGEMGKLAVRALVHRVGQVIVANRDRERASAVAAAHDASSIPLDEVPRVLQRVDAVISAADTRGALLTDDVLAQRMRSHRPLFVVDVAVPRSLDASARALLGTAYRSVDDLPGAAARVPSEALVAARARCETEALRFVNERSPERVEAIRTLRAFAERVRAAKVDRALGRLRHLSERDRRVVEALSTTITNALLHEPTVALREQRADPQAARALFERGQ